jgi:hypothetical protein
VSVGFQGIFHFESVRDLSTHAAMAPSAQNPDRWHAASLLSRGVCVQGFANQRSGIRPSSSATRFLVSSSIISGEPSIQTAAHVIVLQVAKSLLDVMNGNWGTPLGTARYWVMLGDGREHITAIFPGVLERMSFRRRIVMMSRIRWSLLVCCQQRPRLSTSIATLRGT